MEQYTHEDYLVFWEVHVFLPQVGHEFVIRCNRVGQGLGEHTSCCNSCEQKFESESTRGE